MRVWSDAQWLTLQFGPVWVVSALVGRDHLDDLEQLALWSAVSDAPAGDAALSWELMNAVHRDRDWLLDQFMLDERSIVTGLSQVTSILGRVPSAVSRETGMRFCASVLGSRRPVGLSAVASPTTTCRYFDSSGSFWRPLPRQPETTP